MGKNEKEIEDNPSHCAVQYECVRTCNQAGRMEIIFRSNFSTQFVRLGGCGGGGGGGAQSAITGARIVGI